MTVESVASKLGKHFIIEMTTEDPMQIMVASGMRGLGMGSVIIALSSSSALENVAHELGMLLRSHSRLDNVLSWRDMVPHRSGSAPPSVEGSLASLGSLFSSGIESKSGLTSAGTDNGIEIIDSEQELRSDPAYLAYYYSHINLNPRLPPPLLSRENYLLSQRLVVGFGDVNKLTSFDNSSSMSLFSSQPVLPTHKEEPEPLESGRCQINVWKRELASC